MTIVEYFDRFVSCPKKGTDEPCPKCTITREVLTVLAKHVPDWQSYQAAVLERSLTDGADEFGRFHVAAEAAVCAGIFACLMATSTAEKSGEPAYPSGVAWCDTFGGVLARELGRAGVSRRVMVVPRIDVLMAVDDLVKH